MGLDINLHVHGTVLIFDLSAHLKHRITDRKDAKIERREEKETDHPWKLQPCTFSIGRYIEDGY